MTDKKTVLVAGATGAQGGSVARSLIHRWESCEGLDKKPAKVRDIEEFWGCGEWN